MHFERNGMGDLVQQGVWYPIPQNPLNNPTNAPNNAIMEAARNAAVAGKTKGVGDLVTGEYPVPFNPILNGVSSVTMPKAMMADTSNALATSVASLKTGPTASLTGFDLQAMANGMGGLGQDVATDLASITGGVTDFMSGTTFGLSNWIVYGGGAFLAWLLFHKQGGTTHAQRLRKAYAGY